MIAKKPPELRIEDDEDSYHSSSDSDFNNAALSASSGEESSSDDEPTTGHKGGQKRQKRNTDADKDVEMGSGDEGVIAQGRKKKQKKRKGKGKKGKKHSTKDPEEGRSEDESADEEMGGIRVRLRSGRGGEEAQKIAKIPTASKATTDIDAVWSRMNASVSSLPQSKPPERSAKDDSGKENAPPEHTGSQSAPKPAPDPEQTITIPSTYTFAGTTHHTTKIVPISSPEAQTYLAQQAAKNKKRPLARKNLLEPNPQHLLHGSPFPARTDLPPSIGGTGARSSDSAASRDGGKGKAKDVKLNTVEKSKLDWKAEVERLGLQEELAKAEKSGQSYLGRREFLDRVEAGRDDREREARMKERAQ